METPKEFLEGYDPQIKEVGYDSYSYTPQQVIDRLEAYKNELNKERRFTEQNMDDAYDKGFKDFIKEQNRFKFEIGIEVVITKRKHWHGFEVGETVEIIEKELDSDGNIIWMCSNGYEKWFIKEDEAEIPI